MNKLLTYKRFYHLKQAEDVSRLLDDADISYDLITPRKQLDEIFVGPQNNHIDYEIRIIGKDFKKADQILRTKYRVDLEEFEEDYYMFSFTDEELYDVVLNFDEWNIQDFHLAKAILVNRGKQVNQELLDSLYNKKYEAISGGETAPKALVFAGFVLSIFGSPIGMLLGIHLMTSKKTLPDGKRAYIFNAGSRDNGLTIFVISILVMVAILVFYYKQMN